MTRLVLGMATLMVVMVAVCAVCLLLLGHAGVVLTLAVLAGWGLLCCRVIVG